LLIAIDRAAMPSRPTHPTSVTPAAAFAAAAACAAAEAGARGKQWRGGAAKRQQRYGGMLTITQRAA